MFDIPIENLTDPLPKRTAVTRLTDDELLLLDALFQCNGISNSQLQAEAYHWNMNTGYTHRMADDQVLPTLQQWKNEGLVSGEYDADDGVFRWELTKQGGELWEAERQPIWERFVMDWQFYHDLEPDEYPGIDPSALNA